MANKKLHWGRVYKLLMLAGIKGVAENEIVKHFKYTPGETHDTIEQLIKMKRATRAMGYRNGMLCRVLTVVEKPYGRPRKTQTNH